MLFASAGVLTDDGWTAEFAVPFKSLRYPARGSGEAHRWGLQIERDIEGKDENVVWAPISRDVMSELGQMGSLDGMTNLSTSRNLELLPTVTAIQVGRLNAAGDFQSDTVKEAGANLKYGVTSNLTLDFTYNPDFSQIESDRQQIEVNQRFPVLYPELRPFFLEGQEIFRVPGPVTFIHTRTIVDPRYGAKLSGKIGKTTVGLLVANDEAPGKVDNRQDPAFGRTAQFIVGRARTICYRESTASVIFTDREFMNQHSRAIGGDGDFAFGRTHRFFARVIATDHRDAAGVQRKGYFYDFNLRKAGRNVSYSLISNAISPDLRTDVGFVRRTDQRQTLGNISYRWWPETWLISWAPQTEPHAELSVRRHAAGGNERGDRQLLVREEHHGRGGRHARHGALPIDRFLENAVLRRGHHRHQPAADGYGHDERRRPDPLRDRSVSRIDHRLGRRDRASPCPALPIGLQCGRQPVRGHAQPAGRSSTSRFCGRCRPTSSPSGCCCAISPSTTRSTKPSERICCSPTA